MVQCQIGWACLVDMFLGWFSLGWSDKVSFVRHPIRLHFLDFLPLDATSLVLSSQYVFSCSSDVLAGIEAWRFEVGISLFCGE